uniref:RAP2A, member of RAS oncogene family n=1 Tax=Dromaius novaehollandiae TaxID=8790 RepID=A0A8C4J6I0_DRONO
MLCKAGNYGNLGGKGKRASLNSSQLYLYSAYGFKGLSHGKVPVILVGNKVDLESEREVSSNEGRALAEEWGCPFMETSAKSKTMVDELFAEIVRQMNYAAQPDKDDPCCSACNIQ